MIESYSTREIVSAYGSLAESLVDEGYDPIFLSFMFASQRPHSVAMRAEEHESMTEEEAITAVYARSLTRIYRRPHAPENAGRLPVWIACPDYPVPKHAKLSLREVLRNGGRHWHAVVLVPPFCRLRIPFDRLINENPALFTVGPLVRVHAKSIKNHLGYVTGYGLKSLLRGRASFDDLLILPRSERELPCRSRQGLQGQGQQARVDG